MKLKFLLALLVIGLSSASAANHGRKERMSSKNKRDGDHALKKCFKSDAEHMKSWLSTVQECHMESEMMMTNGTGQSTTPKSTKMSKEQKKAHKTCFRACLMKKMVFLNNKPSSNSVKNFAMNLTDDIQESFVSAVNLCFTSKNVALDKLSMDMSNMESCSQWMVPVKCFKSALKMSCKISGMVDAKNTVGKVMNGTDMAHMDHSDEDNDDDDSEMLMESTTRKTS